ncbi:hypothetical protein ACFQU2_11635 [Siccirubricoccus deserti]
MLGAGRRIERGAHIGARPVVPWAQVMTGQPPAGGVPAGMATVPETATLFPAGSVER